MGLLTAMIYGVIVDFGVGAGAGIALAGLVGALGGAAAALALRYLYLGIDLFAWPVVAAPLAAAGAAIGYTVLRRPSPSDGSERRQDPFTR
jgi:hypothetical protein